MVLWLFIPLIQYMLHNIFAVAKFTEKNIQIILSYGCLTAYSKTNRIEAIDSSIKMFEIDVLHP